MAGYEDALKLLNEVAQTGENYETCEEQDTVFNMLDSLGIDLDEDHQDLQDQDDNERVNLFEEAKKVQGGHVMSDEELDALEDETGVSNLGNLLRGLLDEGGMIIGV